MDIIKRNNVKILEGNGDTILYAHGFGCDQNMWRLITPSFQLNHKQVLFDYVGSGQSSLEAFDVTRYSSLDGYAQDIIDVCDALALSNVIFVGHSVSSSAGIIASIKRPDLFKKLILVGPSPCFLNSSDGYRGGFELQDLEDLLMLMEQNYIGWANYLAPIVAGSTLESELAGELSNSFCSTDPLVSKTFAKTTFFSDNREDYAKVNCSSLILQHKHDALASVEVGEYVHTQVKNSELVILDVTGHCAHMSHPELVVSAMQSFLSVS